MTETTEPCETEDEAALAPVDAQFQATNNREWLKMTKGQSLLCSFLYFHTYDVNAVKALRKANKNATTDEIDAAAKKALTDRATALGKRVDQLEPWEELDLETVQFKSIKAHYQHGLGFALSRLGKDGTEADAVWKKLPEPKQYFSTLLLVYPMTREGRHDIEAIKAGQWRVLPWRFGPGTYDEIWNLNDGLRSSEKSVKSIAHCDLCLRCTDTTNQIIHASIHSEARWRTDETLRWRILREAIKHYEGLVPFRQMSTDQLRRKLGVGGRMLGTGEDFTGLLDKV